MKNTIPAILFLLLIHYGFAQETDSLARKVTNKMCDCLGVLNDYETYRQRFDSCYDNAISEVISEKKANEIRIILNSEKKKEMNQKIETLIKTDCQAVNLMIQKELLSVESEDPFPTNFSSKDLKKVKKNIKKWNGKIIAFDVEVIEIKKGYHDHPYFKAKIDNEDIWIASMITSGFEIKGNQLRLLGYVTKIESDDVVKDYHKLGFHILTFGVIDLKTEQLAFFPGSEMQIKEWKSGKVPIGR